MNYSAREIVLFVLTGVAVMAADDGPTGFSLLPRSMQNNPVLNLTVITEMTDEGRKLPAVSAAAPAYYVLKSGGFRQLGDAPKGERSLDVADMARLLTQSLSTNGYRPASPPSHEPSLLILFIWGSHNLTSHVDWSDLPDPTPNDPFDTQGAQSPAQVQRNLLDRAALVGGDAFALKLQQLLSRTADMHLTMKTSPGILPPEVFARTNPLYLWKLQNPKNARLLEHAVEELYFVVASAYHFSAAANNERRLLWRTRMTVSSDGVSQPQTLAPLIATAAPYFGKETTEPQFIHQRVRSGRVEIGTPTVVEEMRTNPSRPSAAP